MPPSPRTRVARPESLPLRTSMVDREEPVAEAEGAPPRGPGRGARESAREDDACMCVSVHLRVSVHARVSVHCACVRVCREDDACVYVHARV